MTIPASSVRPTFGKARQRSIIKTDCAPRVSAPEDHQATRTALSKQSDISAGRNDIGIAALEAACARNAPVEVVRRELAGEAPLARGRMLNLTEDTLEVQRVQVVGRNMTFRNGNELDAYFDYSGTVYHFRTTIKSMSEMVQVNAKLVVPAMLIQRPTHVEAGQRRNTFRVSIGARVEVPTVNLWNLGNGAEPGPEGEPPKEQPDFSGRLADASATGLGVLIENITYSRFKHDTRMLASIHFVETPNPLSFLCEVRQTRAVRGGDSTRLGLLITGTFGDKREQQNKQRVLSDYVQKVQREQLRGNDAQERKAS